MAFKESKLYLSVKSTVEKALGIATPSFEIPLLSDPYITNGILISTCDRIRQGRLTIANAASPQTLDLSDATAKDPVGDTATMAKVCLVAVFNRSEIEAELAQVGGGTNPFMSVRDVPAVDGVLINTNFTVAAWPCTGANANLKFAITSGTNVVLDYLILGRSA